MIKICKHNQENVLEQIRQGKLDAVALSTSNLIDDIILKMNDINVFECLKNNIQDKRAHNTTIPYELIWASAVAAKMRVQTSLSDVPFAINNHRTLAKLGYTVIDSDGSLKSGLMQESSLRFLLGKYSRQMFIDGYNNTVQKGIMPMLDIEPNIHILDCTDLEVNYANFNYEESTITRSKKDNSLVRGYKLATLRGLVDDTGIIEEIRFGGINVHDLHLSEEMVKTSPMLKPGDILINDRGFLSRDLMNYLKTERGVDTYIPLRKDMAAYEEAINIAKRQNDWKLHPNKTRKNQYISFVSDLKLHRKDYDSKDDIPINACVVWDKEEDTYHVFVTTDTTASMKDIILTYELRPEIEEDYRQLKDFWMIEDFKSTKINVILFHIICVLFGYLFFQLYTLCPEGEEFLHKSLPVVLKKYMPEVQPFVVLYVGYEFGVLTLFELLKLYRESSEEVCIKLDPILSEL